MGRKPRADSARESRPVSDFESGTISGGEEDEADRWVPPVSERRGGGGGEWAARAGWATFGRARAVDS